MWVGVLRAGKEPGRGVTAVLSIFIHSHSVSPKLTAVKMHANRCSSQRQDGMDEI